MAANLMSVLLIEDDPDDVLLVKESLAEISYGKIKLEYTGRLSRGLIELSSHAYDVVLLDLNLPDSRGLDTLKTIIKSSERRLVRHAIVDGEVQRLPEIVDIVRRTGAIAATRQAAEREADKARAALAGVPEGPARSALLELCSRSVRRSS